jgi:uncharacterized membrane protein affecting hemolysin expression
VVRYERTDLLHEILSQLLEQPNVLAAFIYNREGRIEYAADHHWLDKPLYQALNIAPQTWHELNANSDITLHHV